MKNELCVSSYSVRQHLGPIHVTMRGPDGEKTSFDWDQPQTMTLLEFPQAAKERFGVDAVEICQFHLAERTPEYVAKLRKALDDAGVSLINMPIDVGNISDANDTYREEDLAEIEEWMRVAAALGSRMVRVNASSPMAHGEVAPVETTVASYKRLTATAASLGMTMLLENHGGITTDPNVIVDLYNAVGSPNFKTLVDIGNFEPMLSRQMAIMQGQATPEMDVEPIYASIAVIAPYAGMLHAKTHEFDAEGNPHPIDVVRALRVVRDAGYEGPISLEYEGDLGDAWVNTLRTKALVEEAFG